MCASLHLNGYREEVPPGLNNLEGLILHAMKKSESLNELVVDVKVDGEFFSEEYEHQAGEIDLSQIGRVDVRTLDAETFSRQFLDQASRYIDFLKGGFVLTIQYLKREEKDIGFDMLARCLDTLGTLKSHLENVCDHVDVLSTDIDASITCSQSFEELVERLYAAQSEDNDPGAIAELLEARVLPFLDAWKQPPQNLGGSVE